MIDLKYKTTLTDAEAVEKVLSGDTAYYELLIRRNNPYLYKVGRSYGFGHEQTQDLMQDTLVNAYLNIEKFENRSSFKTWIIKIMLNQCYHARQKISYKSLRFTGIELNENEMPAFSNHNQDDTSKNVLNHELNNVIEEAISKIPEDYRMVFSLREITGLNVAETAEALHISEANVKVRLNRAKTMLRKEVEKMYTAEDIYEFNLIYCDRIVEKVMSHINKFDHQ